VGEAIGGWATGAVVFRAVSQSLDRPSTQWATEHPRPLARMRRFDKEYEMGTVFALINDQRVGHLQFEVLVGRKVLTITNVFFEDSSYRGRGGGGALFEALEAEYPAPEWAFAVDDVHANSWGGHALIASRRRPGRQWVHTSDCTDLLPEACSCEFVRMPTGPDKGVPEEGFE